MKYSSESQIRALNYLIENAPHDMEKFRNLYNIEVDGLRAEISFDDIFLSKVWTAEEKIQLIKLYGHTENKNGDWRCRCFITKYKCAVDLCIKEKNYSGLQAVLSLGAFISQSTISDIIKYIDDPNERYEYCKLIISYYGDKENIKVCTSEQRNSSFEFRVIEIPTLCDLYYDDRSSSFLINHCHSREDYMSSMKDICATGDLELVKLFLPTVKNINQLFVFAVESQNIEMAKLFIEAGANVNFQNLSVLDPSRRIIELVKLFAKEDDVELSNISEPYFEPYFFKTPLKTAIDNDDLEMVKFLHQNGADLNFVDHSEKMQKVVGKRKKDSYAYNVLTKSPLEYAINIGPGSITYTKVREGKKVGDREYKSFEDRMAIVRYLYENGATFGNGEINYTDLICFAIRAEDYKSTKYFFEEAEKNGSKLDMAKIISFIHEPGVEKDYKYKIFPLGAKPWIKLCEEYSKKIDAENYTRNVKLLLEKIFNNVNYENYELYSDLIADLSKLLPKEELKDIPAIFSVSEKHLESILSLGYDINCIKDDRNILMEYIVSRPVSIEQINKLISLGANINYISPKSGDSALSLAINMLTKYDFYRFESVTNGYTYLPQGIEEELISFVKAIIELSSEEVIGSEKVKENACSRISPGFSQVIYNELLVALSKKGFKVDDDYVADSFYGFLYQYGFRSKATDEYIINPWEYLQNLYNNFSNSLVGRNFYFPEINQVKNFPYGTEQNDTIFNLIIEHLKRNFITSIEQIPNPDEIVNKLTSNTQRAIYMYGIGTALQKAQDNLLKEISRYIGNLDYRQIIELLDNFPFIDIEAINRNELIIKAMEKGEIKLCEELIKRGATIICYDKNGHDVTFKIYRPEQINLFQALSSGQYNPNQEFEDLLREIGCGKGMSRNLKQGN